LPILSSPETYIYRREKYINMPRFSAKDKIRELEEELILLKHDIDNLKEHGVDDVHLIHGLEEVKFNMDDLDVKLYSRLYQMQRMLDSYKERNSAKFRNVAEAMKTMKEIIELNNAEKIKLEKNNQKLAAMLDTYKQKLAEKVLEPAKAKLDENVNLVRTIASDGWDATVEERIPVPDEPIIQILSEEDTRGSIETEDKEVDKEKEKDEQEPDKIVDKKLKKLQLQEEYNDYVKKYGKEPTPAMLIIERMFKKMDRCHASGVDKEEKPAVANNIIKAPRPLKPKVLKRKTDLQQLKDKSASSEAGSFYEDVIKLFNLGKKGKGVGG
jgi:hypothetical protein